VLQRGLHHHAERRQRRSCRHRIGGIGRNQERRMIAAPHRALKTADDLINLVRVVSACTLGLWAFAAGLLIGVFLFS
jgi:hypothetical protein